jgi:transaldolase
MLEAHEKLAAQGVGVRSVSMPCLELFEQQGPEYKESILPKNVRARVSIEAASTIQWARYVGIDGASVGVDTFGKSAPLKILQQDFGLTVDNVLAAANKVLKANGSSDTGGESNALAQLKAMTTIVADTGELDKIKAVLPTDATTNPTLIFQALNSDGGKVMFDKAIAAAMKKMGRHADEEALVSEVCDRLAVMIGCEILKLVPGLVSTEVDANLSFSTEASLAKARHLVELYEEAGVNPRKRVLIKMASTWESVEACRVLERDGIRCNMTLLFSRAQAIACAEAKATLISPFVGRILDWYKKAEGRDYTAEEDPGVLSVRAIYAYYKKHGHKTVVMGASFRTADECLALAGCDKLTISPKVIGEIEAKTGPVPRKLHPTLSAKDAPPRLAPHDLTEKEFRLLLNEDQMATEKLSEGIRGFGKDLAKLKDLVRKRLGVALSAHEAGLKSMS